RRSRLDSVVSEDRRRHRLAAEPRPTRPRNWCSCASPKRSAPSIIITVAFGTSTPTSTTAVATNTWISPATNRCITSSLSWRPPRAPPVRARRRHLAERRQRQRPRDRGCRHGQEMRTALALGPQGLTPACANAMLLVDHGETEVGELDIVFDQRVSTDNQGAV